MIFSEIWYKTHNQTLFAIIKYFKTWYYYLKNCYFKIFIYL